MTDRVEIGPCTIYHGEATAVLASLPSASIDAFVSDPPYAEIDRDYGRLSEPDWHVLMNTVVAESRRLLTPRGSAVFILQPNSERVGRMRPWLWEFMAKWTREWNMVQDAWWWNWATPPTVHCQAIYGLMRPSMKACVWLGESDCHREQGTVLLRLSEASATDSRIERHEMDTSPSGLTMRKGRALATCRDRGGATPFNVVVCSNSDATDGAGGLHGHGAATPMPLTEWWVRYISPKESLVCDPFVGSGTTGIACVKLGRRFIGIERDPGYFEIACNRIRKAWAEENAPLYREDKPA